MAIVNISHFACTQNKLFAHFGQFIIQRCTGVKKVLHAKMIMPPHKFEHGIMPFCSVVCTVEHSLSLHHQITSFIFEWNNKQPFLLKWQILSRSFIVYLFIYLFMVFCYFGKYTTIAPRELARSFVWFDEWRSVWQHSIHHQQTYSVEVKGFIIIIFLFSTFLN